MKRYQSIVVLLLFFTSPVFASSGDGVSFRFSKAFIGINWPDEFDVPVEYPKNSMLSLIKNLSGNYEILERSNKQIYFDYYYSDKKYILSTYVHENGVRVSEDEHRFSILNDVIENILIRIKTEFSLSDIPKIPSYVYVAFIETDYHSPDSPYNSAVESFLRKSELYLAHSAAWQSNEQGYVYSIFFSEEKMSECIKELGVPKILTNRKNVDEKSYDSWRVVER